MLWHQVAINAAYSSLLDLLDRSRSWIWESKKKKKKNLNSIKILPSCANVQCSDTCGPHCMLWVLLFYLLALCYLETLEFQVLGTEMSYKCTKDSYRAWAMIALHITRIPPRHFRLQVKVYMKPKKILSTASPNVKLLLSLATHSVATLLPWSNLTFTVQISC